MQDFWTYEYCHRKHVRQFRLDTSRDPPRQLAVKSLGKFDPADAVSASG